VLIQAIGAISKDEIWAERKIITKVIGRFLATRKSTLTLKLGLTKREDEIVKLIIQGYSNKQIANKLSISNQTVKNHLVNVFNKLGISNRLNLVLNLR
jgi:DNA-binding NarL/FixJ family response regulator